jgi:hypothetical protein
MKNRMTPWLGWVRIHSNGSISDAAPYPLGDMSGTRVARVMVIEVPQLSDERRLRKQAMSIRKGKKNPA